ncbi:DUF2231 domain-containing protein [Crocosphaera chwakensis]|uniref:DUF2231 domain-containing protein n=1 Tax=Crocosphaera chwakensis CCY0110 TaxID=391612 RepID=A3IST0_9CHRO|nr:DUF2231 domain-containing protein [Crocosphaera chwakensis]EAZ90500.1 hypothetical protein CY0110_26772 [Crocosphaera chwakensis CCY0110]
MNEGLIKQLGLNLGANGLPYEFPWHPILVHFTLGLFIIAILFDWAGTLFYLTKPILKFLGLRARRANFYDLGWYNLVAATFITFFTVTAGFFEIMLAQPSLTQKSSWGLGAGSTMILHGVGGILLLSAIAILTVWRGYQRYCWRKTQIRQVQWSYLGIGFLMLIILFIHGTLGAQMGDEFAIHNTAASLLQKGQNPNQVLRGL